MSLEFDARDPAFMATIMQRLRNGQGTTGEEPYTQDEDETVPLEERSAIGNKEIEEMLRDPTQFS